MPAGKRTRKDEIALSGGFDNPRGVGFGWSRGKIPDSPIVPGTDRYDRHIAKRRAAEAAAKKKKQAAKKEIVSADIKQQGKKKAARKKIDRVLSSTKKAKAKASAAKKALL
jgi:hypothetical protein